MDIIAIGEPLMELSDVNYANRRVYLPGFGGDTSNFIVAAARQGAQTGYYTRLGNDTFGRSFINLWRQEHVDTSCVELSDDAHTGMYFITHNESGHEFSYMRKGSAASRMTMKDIPRAYIAGAKLLHVSGISQAISESACDAIFEAVAVARENGVKVSYDPNLRLKLWPLDRARAVIHATVAMCDLFMPSLEDACTLTGLDDPDSIADYYHGLGAANVVLKLGRKGVLVSGVENGISVRKLIPGHVVDTVDQTGAGDTFDGAFCTRYIQGDGLVASARYANAAAALSTQGYGAVIPIPVKEKVEEFLAAQK